MVAAPRARAAGVEVNGKIVLAGGMGVSGEPLAGVDIVDLDRLVAIPQLAGQPAGESVPDGDGAADTLLVEGLPLPGELLEIQPQGVGIAEEVRLLERGPKAEDLRPRLGLQEKRLPATGKSPPREEVAPRSREIGEIEVLLAADWATWSKLVGKFLGSPDPIRK